MPSQQDGLDEPLEVIEPVPIKIEREEPEVDIATVPAPKAPEPKSAPSQAPQAKPPAVPPRQEESLERDIEAEPVADPEAEAPEVEPDPEPGDEAPFEYDQAGFAILDESWQLQGSTACGNQEGCFQVDAGFRDASGDLEALFQSRGYDFDEIQVAEDSEYKAYRLTNRDNPGATQYLYVLNREIDVGPGQFPKIVAFYVVTQEAQTLAELNQTLGAN